MRGLRTLRARWLMWRAGRDFAAAARHRETAATRIALGAARLDAAEAILGKAGRLPAA